MMMICIIITVCTRSNVQMFIPYLHFAYIMPYSHAHNGIISFRMWNEWMNEFSLNMRFRIRVRVSVPSDCSIYQSFQTTEKKDALKKLGGPEKKDSASIRRVLLFLLLVEIICLHRCPLCWFVRNVCVPVRRAIAIFFLLHFIWGGRRRWRFGFSSTVDKFMKMPILGTKMTLYVCAVPLRKVLCF